MRWRNWIVRWVDMAVKRLTTITFPRLSKYAIWALVAIGAGSSFILPSLRFFAQKDSYSSWTSIFVEWNSFGQSDSLGAPYVAIVCAIGIVLIIRYNFLHHSTHTSNSVHSSKAKAKFKGNNNIIVQNSNNINVK